MGLWWRIALATGHPGVRVALGGNPAVARVRAGARTDERSAALPLWLFGEGCVAVGLQGAIRAGRLGRLRLAAARYLAEHGAADCRFDVVAMTPEGIRLIKHAF